MRTKAGSEEASISPPGASMPAAAQLDSWRASRRSKTVACPPWRARRQAVVSPMIPAPAMAIFFMSVGENQFRARAAGDEDGAILQQSRGMAEVEAVESWTGGEGSGGGVIEIRRRQGRAGKGRKTARQKDFSILQKRGFGESALVRQRAGGFECVGCRIVELGGGESGTAFRIGSAAGDQDFAVREQSGAEVIARRGHFRRGAESVDGRVIDLSRGGGCAGAAEEKDAAVFEMDCMKGCARRH